MMSPAPSHLRSAAFKAVRRQWGAENATIANVAPIAPANRDQVAKNSLHKTVIFVTLNCHNAYGAKEIVP
jgi:hypothetical protein